MFRKSVLRAIRLTALAATASVLVLVMACGGGEDEEPTAAPDAATPTEAAAETPTAATETPAAATLPILAAVPNAPPREPPPTPDPNETPPPDPIPPAPEVREIFFYVDTVTAGAGESDFNVDADKYCTISSLFRRGMHIVWRVIASDNTGTELQGDDVAEAVLKVPGAEDVNFRFGKHGASEDAPWFWTAAWDVPPDYPLGHVDFTVQFTTTDGRSGTFKQIPVSAPDRGIESRLQIIG